MTSEFRFLSETPAILSGVLACGCKEEKMRQLARVLATFVDKESGATAQSEGITASLLDSDPLKNDLLATAILANGSAEFIFDVGSARSLDTPFETKPDLFITLSKEGHEFFRTRVHHDIDFLARNPVTELLDHLTIDLGKFEV